MLVLFTDTDTDITLDEANKYGYHLISMPYIIDDIEIKPYEDFTKFNYKEYYDKLRQGAIPSTCAISPLTYYEYFEPYFKNGDDILYVHFSKAMSGTFNAMNIALEELKEKYPKTKFYTIDTNAIAICSYNIVIQIGKMYNEGKTIDELLLWADEHVNKFAIYFYADDLKFFKRSGRVGNIAGLMGNILGIHPIIHINLEGKMVNLTKVKGKKSTLNKIVSFVKEKAEDIYNYPVIIGHTDAIDIAHHLASLLQEQFDNKLNIEYVVVNPTAGAHCGPNCVGVCFHANSR